MTDLRRSGRRNVKIVLLFISFVLFPFRIEEDCTWVVVFVCLLFVMGRVGSGRRWRLRCGKICIRFGGRHPA